MMMVADWRQVACLKYLMTGHKWSMDPDKPNQNAVGHPEKKTRTKEVQGRRIRVENRRKAGMVPHFSPSLHDISSLSFRLSPSCQNSMGSKGRDSSGVHHPLNPLPPPRAPFITPSRVHNNSLHDRQRENRESPSIARPAFSAKVARTNDFRTVENLENLLVDFCRASETFLHRPVLSSTP